MLHKRFLSAVLLLIILALPVQGASFKRINDRQFIDICDKGSEQEIIEALNNGANVNAKDNHGTTAIIFAARSGHLEALSMLINTGANVNAKNYDGYTALIFAAENGHLGVINALINAGALMLKSVTLT